MLNTNYYDINHNFNPTFQGDHLRISSSNIHELSDLDP